MSPEIERLSSTASSQQLCEILERDGAVIVENILKPKQLASLNSELDRFVSKVEAGLRHPTTDEMIEFYGQSTIRIDGLPAKSKTFLDVMLLPQLCETADHFLLPNCTDYIFNTGQLIQIGPIFFQRHANLRI